MKRLQVVLAVLVAVVVAALLAKAVGVGGTPKRAVAPPRTMTAEEARRAEEKLLDERSFSHPVDTAAPVVEVQRPDGSTVKLTPAPGKVTFVNFWATWCPPCIAEMPSMLQLGRELAERHPGTFQMVAVSGDDSWEAVRDYFAKNFGGVPSMLSVVRDPDATAARAYYCTARGYCPDVKVPETSVVDRSGRIVAMMVGPRDWTDPAARRWLEFLIQG